MDINTLFAELESRFAADIHISDDDVRRWIGELGISRDVLYDGVAAVRAFGFHHGARSFEFCDWVMGGMYAGEFYGRGLFQRVYLAFDEGEYHHRGRRLDEDPVGVYTRPQIAEIVGSMEGQGGS